MGLVPRKAHLRHDVWHRNRHRQDGRTQELFQRSKWEREGERVWEKVEPSERHVEQATHILRQPIQQLL